MPDNGKFLALGTDNQSYINSEKRHSLGSGNQGNLFEDVT